MFQKEISKKTQNRGWTDQLRGCYSVLGPSGPIRNLLEEATCSPRRACCFWLKLPAHLGELGDNLRPHFSYKMASEAEGKGFNTFGNQISLKISEEKKKEGENQGRGTSVTLPWRFRDRFPERSSTFFIRSSIFNWLVFDFEALNSFYAPLGVHSCFVCFHLHLVYFRYSFSSF